MLSYSFRTKQGIILQQDLFTISYLNLTLNAFFTRNTTANLFIIIVLTFLHFCLLLLIRLPGTVIAFFITFKTFENVVILLRAHIFFSSVEEVLDNDI